MLFDKQYYYNYIIDLERRLYLYFFINITLFTILFFLIGYIFSNIILFSLLGFCIGCYFGLLSINREKIKIEEMKMHLDIYNKIFE